jgi:hypothetical protein
MDGCPFENSMNNDSKLPIKNPDNGLMFGSENHLTGVMKRYYRIVCPMQ